MNKLMLRGRDSETGLSSFDQAYNTHMQKHLKIPTVIIPLT